MYDELIAELRQHHCDAKEDDTQEVCEECSYDVIIVDKSAPSGIASVCVCGLMNRAADAIEELSKPKWIPVTERLPENDQDVLVMVHWRDYPENMMCYGRKYKTSWYLWNGELGELIKGFDITHWMPLPQPPKEET